MDTSKLNNKAMIAGILIVLYGLLYLPQMGLNYSLSTIGLQGLVNPNIILYALTAIIAGVTLIVRHRIVAAIGLFIWAAYQVFSLVSSIVTIMGIYADRDPELLSVVMGSQMPSWIAGGLLIVATVLAAVSILLSGKSGSGAKILRFVAIGFAALWWIVTVVLAVRSLMSYFAAIGSNPEMTMRLGILALGQLRCFMAMVGLILAAFSGSAKQPAAIASQQPLGMPAGQFAPAAYGQAPYGQPAAYGQQFGQPVGEYGQAHCPACGADIDASMAFCRMCGQPLSGSGQSQFGQPVQFGQTQYDQQQYQQPPFSS